MALDPHEAVAALLRREGTAISWADFTFNAWLGCTKVGPPCANCYAEDLMGTEGSRLKIVGWGAGEERKRTSAANWAKPLRWQKVAAAASVTLDVFSLSLGDWADNEVPDAWRLDLADSIRATPNLRWMLLTKRIPNVERYLRAMFPEGVPHNVALGITVALQNEADRDIPRAIEVKKRLGISALFLSMEPLLGPVDLDRAWLRDIDLVIVGGESGRNARPMHPAWAISLMEQCVGAGVRFHFKQWGEFRPYEGEPGVEGFWLDPNGSVYQGPTQWPPAENEPRVYMLRVGTKKAGHLMRGHEYRERLAA
jgi:protein gp37